MRSLVIAILLACCCSVATAQNISGKWVGYAIQDTGELCQTCNFTLNLSHKKSIWGESRTFQKDTTDISISLYGYIDKEDSIRLTENEQWVITRKTLNDNWLPCVKKFMLKYHTINNQEYLLGRGTGEEIDERNMTTGVMCIPALFVFARSTELLTSYIAMHKDSLLDMIMPPKREVVTAERLPEFTPSFIRTSINKITEIEVGHTNLQIQLRDYLREDNDTVSIYLNRKLLASKKRIAKQPILIPFSIQRTGSNELLIYAENLGLVPPNTSEMYVIDGKKSYRIMIESDLQKTAAVYLRYKPE